jgi:hypothetical protein
MNVKYKFVNDFQDTNPDTTYTKYYQICTFPDPQSNRYEIRRFVIDNEDTFASVKVHRLSKRDFDKLLKAKKCHEYKLFPTYNLSNIDYPTLADISTCRSTMISNNLDYYGYAPF